VPPEEREHNPWLLLIHSIPPKPDYLRAKIGRRLHRIGAVAVKNAVYVLPRTDETQEDFEWVRREIIEGGGDAWICEASFVEGRSNGDIAQRFRDVRDADYQALGEEANALLASLGTKRSTAEQRTGITSDFVRLKRRVSEVTAIDFFDAPSRTTVTSIIARIEDRVRHGSNQPVNITRARTTQGEFHARTWVTRQHVHVDRMASAWLIRQFIDGEARFRFVEPKGYAPDAGELRFDMFEGEYTHEGNRCTFETLLARFSLDDPALTAIAEIVHEIDLKDATFGRDEVAGVEQLLTGIALAHDDDAARIERASAVFDDLYVAFGKTARTKDGTRRHGSTRRR
jgi:hypothetical protein